MNLENIWSLIVLYICVFAIIFYHIYKNFSPILIIKQNMVTKYTVNFQGIMIEAVVTNKASAIDEWISNFPRYPFDQTIVGLDCEWKPNTISTMNNKTAALQLCIDTKCLVVQMFYLDYIPPSLKTFLSTSSFTFIGVEVQDDALTLYNEYGLSVTCTSDIQAFTMARWPLKFYRKPGLKDLANNVVGLYIQKPLHVCRSNWDVKNLTPEQIEYACIDAYASHRIGRMLIKEM